MNIPGLSAPGNPFYFGAKVHENVRIEDVEQAVVFTSALLDDRQGSTDAQGNGGASALTRSATRITRWEKGSSIGGGGRRVAFGRPDLVRKESGPVRAARRSRRPVSARRRCSG
jgi:hypothetical protein